MIAILSICSGDAQSPRRCMLVISNYGLMSPADTIMRCQRILCVVGYIHASFEVGCRVRYAGAVAPEPQSLAQPLAYPCIEVGTVHSAKGCN
jgi:hypothetical protein